MNVATGYVEPATAYREMTLTPEDIRTVRRSRLRDHCIFCGRSLWDVQSLEASYGPECARQRRLPYGEGHRAKVNVLIEQVDQAQQRGDFQAVLRLANEIAACGYTQVAIEVQQKWGPDIQIRFLNDDFLMVKTPKRLGEDTFWDWVNTCRSHRFTFDQDLKVWKTSVNQLEEIKKALGEVEGFVGQDALGPDGRLFIVGLEP